MKYTIITLGTLLIALLISCTDPTYNNPLDPQGDHNGDNLGDSLGDSNNTHISRQPTGDNVQVGNFVNVIYFHVDDYSCNFFRNLVFALAL